MSELAVTRGAPDRGAFGLRTIVALLVVGIVAFAAMLVLGAYAPDLRPGNNGGAHALSNAATGYSGIVRLAQATGRNAVVIRDEQKLDSENLVVLTPESPATDMTKVLALRQSRATLVVLPKWITAPDRVHRGWVGYIGLLAREKSEGVLAPQYKLHVDNRPSGGRPLVAVDPMLAGVHFAAPRPLRVISGNSLTPVLTKNGPRWTGKIEPLLTDGAGGIVLGKIADRPLYVLADPDLLSNRGMRSAAQAQAALRMLDELNSNQADGIIFDVTLNGFGHSRSPLRLLFDPPFLALTLAVTAAVLLAGVQATARFGAPRLPERAIAFGKTALIENTAALVRKAGRQATLGERYADLLRERARSVVGVPARLQGPALDAYLDGVGGRARFSTLVGEARDARDGGSALAAAQALHRWLWETRR